MQYVRRRKRFIVKGLRAGGRFIDVMRWQFATRKARWPREVANVQYDGPPPAVYRDGLSATWLGHSTVLLQTDGLNILTDPFLSMRASPVTFAGPKRVRPAAYVADQLPNIDIVLLSHNHYDHLDLPGLKQLLRHHSPKFITPIGNGKYIRGLFRGADCVELDWREATEVVNFRITVMPAQHWSKRTFDDANHSLWGAFVIETPGGVIYFAGDTGYGDGATFLEVQDRFGPPRLSLLPIGAYEPRWFMKSMHMNPDDAVRAHLDLASKTSLGIHHGTIQLTNESIDQPLTDLAAALAVHKVHHDHFVTPDVGETVVIR